jgi:thiol:disulfide interchange protein DsbA
LEGDFIAGRVTLRNATAAGRTRLQVFGPASGRARASPLSRGRCAGPGREVIMSARISRRRFVAAAAATLPVLALAQTTSGRFEEGMEYRQLRPPLPTDGGERVLVLDFFQYSCPHCFAFLRGMEGWRARHAGEIVYRRQPINWDREKVNHTRLFYALAQLERLEDMHERVFREIHINRANLDPENRNRFMLRPDDIAGFMAANGIDREAWKAAFESAAVSAEVERAVQTWKAYGVESTPSVALDGRYLTSPTMIGSRDGTLVALDTLLQRARAERAAAPAG